jgi:hypothetical protein
MTETPVERAFYAQEQLRLAQESLASWRLTKNVKFQGTIAVYERRVCVALDDLWAAQQALIKWCDEIAYEQQMRSKFRRLGGIE